jgi:rhodanese-related sulfurtransferase
LDVVHGTDNAPGERIIEVGHADRRKCPMETITRQQLKAKLDAGADIKLVMTVGGWTYRARHIPGSVSYPSPSWALRELRRDDQIILYSTDHSRQDTAIAFDALTAHGYRNVCCYLGGLADWEDAGYPVEGEGLARPPSVGPTGAALVAESCAAAARTVTTAGRAPAGRPRQPRILDGGMASKPGRQLLKLQWLRSTRTLTSPHSPEGAYSPGRFEPTGDRPRSDQVIYPSRPRSNRAAHQKPRPGRHDTSACRERGYDTHKPRDQ